MSVKEYDYVQRHDLTEGRSGSASQPRYARLSPSIPMLTLTEREEPQSSSTILLSGKSFQWWHRRNILKPVMMIKAARFQCVPPCYASSNYGTMLPTAISILLVRDVYEFDRRDFRQFPSPNYRSKWFRRVLWALWALWVSWSEHWQPRLGWSLGTTSCSSTWISTVGQCLIFKPISIRKSGLISTLSLYSGVDQARDMTTHLNGQ